MTARAAWGISRANRSQLFFGLFLLATLNAFVGLGLREIESIGFAGAAWGLFGISAILWVALAAGLSILRDGDDAGPWRGLDPALGIFVLAAALLPVATASSLALTLAALWAIFSSGTGTPLRRAGLVFLAMTGALIWGRLLLAWFSRPLLDLDALFVAGALGVDHHGNLLWSADGATRLLVAPGCSSMQGMSLALLFWATVNQYYKVPFGWKAAFCCVAAQAATIAVNVARIGAMLHWPAHLEAIHHGWGFQLSMWVTLVLVVAICLAGARREVFGRA
jgi:exosortase/archaeosortase family protein